MVRRRIIALVGIDGSGKSTQADWLAVWLNGLGVPASHVKNPGGRVRLGRFARRLGRPDAAALLGERGVSVMEWVVRWLALLRALTRTWLSRRVAVMDRYTHCQLAVLRARGHGGERLTRLVYGVFPEPDLVLFLAVPPQHALERVRTRGTDTETLEHLRALDDAYRALPEAVCFHAVDATGTPTEVKFRIRRIVAGSVVLSVPGGSPGGRASIP
jgi:dTMP kinase